MTEQLKPSRYNHFVKQKDGKWLAFNAMKCGLAEIEETVYDKFFQSSGEEKVENLRIDGDGELLDQLKKGGFLIEKDVDELDVIRTNHYKSRFSGKAFGLTIIPTLRCNFACDYCYEKMAVRSSVLESENEMSDKVYDNIVRLSEKQVPEESLLSITWYGGEPLLQKEVIKRLSIELQRVCKLKQSIYLASIVTNGYLLDKDTLEFLEASHISHAQITVDGPREIHDLRRALRNGGGTYEQIMLNLSNIGGNTPLAVSIRINIDKRNRNSIHELLEDFKVRGFNKVRNISLYFGQVLHYSNSCPGLESLCMITEEFSDFMVEAYSSAINMGFRITQYPMIMPGTCAAIRTNGAVIEPNGNVHKCWNTVGDDLLKTGVLTDKGIQHNHNNFKWMGWMPFDGKCRDCIILPLCEGGCAYRRLYKLNIGDAENNTCIWWKYNLSSMLEVIKSAIGKNLLIGPLSEMHKGGES